MSQPKIALGTPDVTPEMFTALHAHVAKSESLGQSTPVRVHIPKLKTQSVLAPDLCWRMPAMTDFFLAPINRIAAQTLHNFRGRIPIPLTEHAAIRDKWHAWRRACTKLIHANEQRRSTPTNEDSDAAATTAAALRELAEFVVEETTLSCARILHIILRIARYTAELPHGTGDARVDDLPRSMVQLIWSVPTNEGVGPLLLPELQYDPAVYSAYLELFRLRPSNSNCNLGGVHIPRQWLDVHMSMVAVSLFLIMRMTHYLCEATIDPKKVSADMMHAQHPRLGPMSGTFNAAAYLRAALPMCANVLFVEHPERFREYHRTSSSRCNLSPSFSASVAAADDDVARRVTLRNLYSLAQRLLDFVDNPVLEKNPLPSQGWTSENATCMDVQFSKMQLPAVVRKQLFDETNLGIPVDKDIDRDLSLSGRFFQRTIMLYSSILWNLEPYLAASIGEKNSDTDADAAHRAVCSMHEFSRIFARPESQEDTSSATQQAATKPDPDHSHTGTATPKRAGKKTRSL